MKIQYEICEYPNTLLRHAYDVFRSCVFSSLLHASDLILFQQHGYNTRKESKTFTLKVTWDPEIEEFNATSKLKVGDEATVICKARLGSEENKKERMKIKFNGKFWKFYFYLSYPSDRRSQLVSHPDKNYRRYPFTT